MSVKIIGIGAGGNKGVINLIEKDIIVEKDTMILNTTTKDIPEAYKDKAIIFSDTFAGCGKEPKLSKALIEDAMSKDKLVIDTFFDPSDTLCIICTSIEGGTGNGAAGYVANYVKNVLEKNVMIFGFAGFEDDPRGMENTISFFKELNEDIILQVISNKSFLEECYNSREKAEMAANDEFGRRVRTIMGSTLIDAETNIDATDLYKLTTTPGYMTVESASLEGCKNVEMYDKVISKMLDNSHSLEFSATCKRLGVILNITSKTVYDHTHRVLKDRFGQPYETYLQVQNNMSLPEMITVVASGMDMPMDAVKAVYNRYQEASRKVNRSSNENFFSDMSSLNVGDNNFDLQKRDNTTSIADKKKNFFNTGNTQAAKQPEKKEATRKVEGIENY